LRAIRNDEGGSGVFQFSTAISSPNGALCSNAPVRFAVKQGARRLIILPTGHACANDAPPVSAVANAPHALTLLIARQLVNELENLGLQGDGIRLNRHHALDSCLSMIFSEIRFTLFRIML
jgi:hypothetical protein